MPTLTDPQPALPPTAPRWMKLGLALSLTLNLVILALVAGALARGPGLRADRMAADGFGAYARAMDRADRRALFHDMQKSAGDGTPAAARAAREAHLAAVAQALQAEPFRLEDLKAAMAAQEAGMHGQITLAHGVLLAYLGAMSDEKRRALGARLQRRGVSGP